MFENLFRSNSPPESDFRIRSPVPVKQPSFLEIIFENFPVCRQLNCRECGVREEGLKELAESYIKQGMECATEGDVDRAEFYFLKAYELRQDGDVLSALGWFYGLHLGRTEEGFRYFRRAIRHDPDSGDPYNECGNLLFRAGMARDSLKWFHRSLKCEKNPRKHFILYNLAVVYHQLNRPERSLRYLNLALRFKSDFERAQTFLDEIRNELSYRSPSETP